MSDLKENINVKKIDCLKRQADQIWEEELKPLIEKRNAILDAHDNSLESFRLPQVRLLDKEIDTLESKMHEAAKEIRSIVCMSYLERKSRNILKLKRRLEK